MLTITQAWLDALPAWYDSGWRVGDTINLASYVVNHTDVQDKLANHPPTGPHH